MDGNKPHQPLHDFSDPFNAGQMIGMLMILLFIERHKGINIELLEKFKQTAAINAQAYLEKPSEDIILMADAMLQETELF